MVTALDCAYLAEDVYSREDNRLAQSEGWRRLDAQNWSNGFAAGLYEKNGERVIAFRGTETDDVEDLIADAHMVPAASPRQIQRVVPTLLNEYGVGDRTEMQVGGAMLGGILSSLEARAATAVLANQVPPEQTQQAESYLRRQSTPPTYLTGHSLGGALAKVIALRSGIACVAFNSPFMGHLRGVVPMSSEQIISINARLDPLSLATRTVGNPPHGPVIEVETARCRSVPPSRPRDYECPRVGSDWYMSEQGIYGYMATAFCEVTRPIGAAVTASERYLEYEQGLLRHLGEAALHYHSMGNLRASMMPMPRFRRSLGH